MKNYLPVWQTAQWTSAVRRYRWNKQPARKKIRLLSCVLIIGLVITGLLRLLQPVDFTTTRISRVHDSVDHHWIGQLGMRIAAAQTLGRTQFSPTRVPIQTNKHQSIKNVAGIHPQFDHHLDAETVFVYEDADLDGIDKEELILYSSAGNSIRWEPHLYSVVYSERNTVSTEGVAQFSLMTISG